MTEFVSTNARTFARPPGDWNISDWNSPKLWFDGSPQTMTADYILEGVTGASGHVDEPYLVMTPRPDLLLPAYYNGRNLAESYYLSIRSLELAEYRHRRSLVFARESRSGQWFVVCSQWPRLLLATHYSPLTTDRSPRASTSPVPWPPA